MLENSVGQALCYSVERLVEAGGGVVIDPELTQLELQQARIDALRATWALKGHGRQMVAFSDKAIASGAPDEQVDELLDAGTSYLMNEPHRVEATRRLVGIPSRRKLLLGTMAVAGSGRFRGRKLGIDKAEARDRLGVALDVLDGRVIEPDGDLSGVIFTQTRLDVGNDFSLDRHLPFGMDKIFESGVQCLASFIPYLGGAVLYAEMMRTGRFKDITFVDFKNRLAVDRAIEHGADLAFVTGATTYDRDHTRSLNQKLRDAGITTVNGGVAPTLDMHPARYLRDGVSVFVGELEGGVAPALVKELTNDPTPRIFERGGNGRRGLRIGADDGANRVLLPVAQKVDMPASYSEGVEIEERNLALRLEALAAMQYGFELNGTQRELPEKLWVHQINTSFGCPERCTFCATEPFQGTEMRHRTLESLETELAATEAKYIAITDQNFTANGRDFFVDFMELCKKYGKQFAYEGELMFFLECPEGGDPQKYFFDGTLADAQRKQLLKETILALEVGLEQPVKVKGTIKNGKDPDQFTKAIGTLNEMGIIVFGTAMVGLPRELWSPHHGGEEPIVPYENMSDKEWDEMINTWVEWSKQYPCLVLFPFAPIPGTKAYKMLEQKGLLNYVEDGYDTEDTIVPLQDNPVVGIDARRAYSEIQAAVYGRLTRGTRIEKGNFTPKARVFVELFNRISSSAFGSRME